MLSRPIILWYSLWFLIAVVSLSSCSSTQRGSQYSSSKKRSTRDKSGRSPSYTKTYTHKTKDNVTKSKKSTTSVSVSSSRQKIVDSAHQYIGKPYKAGGKKPETGFDCSGFTGYIFTQNGIQISGPSHDLAKLGRQKSREKLIPGDLVFFGNQERISHVAIVSSVDREKLEIIHSTTSAGVKVDNIVGSPYWESRFLFGIDIIDSNK